MYSTLDYGHMIADEIRMKAYWEALRHTVRPGSVVLDVGTGTGVFAMLACQLGARRVYAVEPDSAIQVARELASANGYADRIRFFEAPMEEVELGERVDVLISDMRGVLPFSGTQLRVLAEARHRFLKPGGTMIPLRDEIWAAPIEAPELYRRNVESWVENRWGVDMEAARRLVVNSAWPVSSVRPTLLGDPLRVGTVDYHDLRDPSLRAQVRWPITHPGTAHAFLLWFKATLAEGIEFSTGPDGEELVYGRICLPLAAPVEVAEGDGCDLTLGARLVGDDYVYTWDSVFSDRDVGRPKLACFSQSSFLGSPLSKAALSTRAPSHAPGLNLRGRIDRTALGLMAEGMTLETIARRLSRKFPDRFPTTQEALIRVSALSATYGSPQEQTPAR